MIDVSMADMSGHTGIRMEISFTVVGDMRVSSEIHMGSQCGVTS